MPTNPIASAAQKAALDTVASRMTCFDECPRELQSAAGACRELRGADAYSDPECTVRPFNYAALSLPAMGSEPRPISEVWGDGGDEVVDEFLRNEMLDSQSVKERLDKPGVVRPCMDPALAARPLEFARFLKWAAGCGVISYALEKPDECVGLFCVAKKNGKL